MKVLLISPPFPLSFLSYSKAMRRLGRKAIYPSLSLITVAALLPREWQLRLVDTNVEPVTDQMWGWAEMVMLTGMAIQREGLLALIREAKARGKTVVVGGPYPTSVPQEALEAGADFLVRGEGENTIPQLLSALAEGRPGGVIECDTKPDLATSPLPRYDLVNLKDYYALLLQTSRGCPHNCEFCDIVHLYGRRPRYKAPGQVMAELEAIYRLGWRGAILVCDDNFIGSKTHARALLGKLLPWSKSHGEPFVFTTQTTVSLGQDVPLIDLMTEANFAEVCLGIESPDEEALTVSQKYHNRPASMEESIHRIKANGLTVRGSFILGMDGEKSGVGDRIIALMDAANIPLVMFNLLQPVPNTLLWQRLEREGRLLHERIHEAPFGSIGVRPAFIPSRPEEQVMADYLKVWTTAYEPRRFLARTYQFFLGMRPTRDASARQRGNPLPSTETPLSLGQKLRNFYSFLVISWQLGVVSSARVQYWRQLWSFWRKNPSRIREYMNMLAMGEDMFRVRDYIRQRLTGAPGA